MTTPSMIMGVILSTILGLLFHLWKGGSLLKMLFYTIISISGFWIGHFLAVRFGWEFGKIGTLYAGPAFIICILFLFIGHWLSLVEVKSKQ